MTNSIDSDQMASSEAIWSGSTLFAKVGVVGKSRIRVKKQLHQMKLFLKIHNGMTNCADTDQTALFREQSDLGLHCLHVILSDTLVY